MNDFFTWSKILPAFFYPLPFFLMLVLIISFFLKKAPVRWLLRILAIGFWLISTSWFVNLIDQFWESPRKTYADLDKGYDAAVVLGGLSDPVISTEEHIEFNRRAERIIEAIQFYKEGRVKKILISCGSGELLQPDAVEAPRLAQFAIRNGVKAADVLIESASRNTHENAVFTMQVMKKNRLKTALLITSCLHMKRSKAIFEKEGFSKNGMSFATWPVDTDFDSRAFPFNSIPEPSALSTLQTTIKEMVGFVVYAFQGYL